MNDTKEIEVGGQMYQIGKLDLMMQWHLTRRLAPILATAGISLAMLADGSKKLEMADFIPSLGPVAQIMSMMDDKDSDYIIFHCLAVVKRKDGERWAPLTQGKGFMYQDVDMPGMLRLVVEVLKHNLQNFTLGLAERMTSASS
jgi:hypothetical protein